MVIGMTIMEKRSPAIGTVSGCLPTPGRTRFRTRNEGLGDPSYILLLQCLGPVLLWRTKLPE